MTRILVIIDAAHLASARALLEQPPFNHTPEQAAQTFVQADQGGAYFWLSAQVNDAAHAACIQLAAALPWVTVHEYDMDANPDFPRQWLAANGLQPFTPPVLP